MNDGFTADLHPEAANTNPPASGALQAWGAAHYRGPRAIGSTAKIPGSTSATAPDILARRSDS
jgi:hypothetical protein